MRPDRRGCSRRRSAGRSCAASRRCRNSRSRGMPASAEYVVARTLLDCGGGSSMPTARCSVASNDGRSATGRRSGRTRSVSVAMPASTSGIDALSSHRDRFCAREPRRRRSRGRGRHRARRVEHEERLRVGAHTLGGVVGEGGLGRCESKQGEGADERCERDEVGAAVRCVKPQRRPDSAYPAAVGDRQGCEREQHRRADERAERRQERQEAASISTRSPACRFRRRCARSLRRPRCRSARCVCRRPRASAAGARDRTPRCRCSGSARTAVSKSPSAVSAWLASRPPPREKSPNARMPSSVAACDARAPRPRASAANASSARVRARRHVERVVESRPRRAVARKSWIARRARTSSRDAEQAAPRGRRERAVRRPGRVRPYVVARERALPARGRRRRAAQRRPRAQRARARARTAALSSRRLPVEPRRPQLVRGKRDRAATTSTTNIHGNGVRFRGCAPGAAAPACTIGDDGPASCWKNAASSGDGLSPTMRSGMWSRR